ncbi:universal stress protein Sll1388-like isoform X2 [Mytilus trossulus]|uniref:universal stress protein Sll1388-like isoform X2 n=1 Tax=Mytilus trossulus TaxID=6551 RepID=UPI003004D8CC
MAEEAKPKARVVLIAMDGSDYAKYAYQWYLDHIHKDDDNITMLYSAEFTHNAQLTSWMYAPYAFDRDTLANLLDQEAQTLRHKLEEYAQMMRETKVHGTVKSIHAERPGEGIVKAAEEAHADLVIVGSRGHGKVRRTLLGSVSDYVLHHSHVPVIVCRHKDDHHHHGHHDKEHTEEHKH